MDAVPCECRIVFAVGDLLRRFLNGRGNAAVEQAQFRVGLGGVFLDQAGRWRNGRGKRSSLMGKFSTARAVCAP
jgi:hypothetical protein